MNIHFLLFSCRLNRLRFGPELTHKVKIFKLFAFSFLLSSFLFYLCSPFGLRVSGAAQKDWVIAQKTLKQTGVAHPDSYREVE